MKKGKTVRNRADEKQQGPDCSTCVHRDGCARYAENSFCTRWADRLPEKEGPDPNDLWRRGEQVDF